MNKLHKLTSTCTPTNVTQLIGMTNHTWLYMNELVDECLKVKVKHFVLFYRIYTSSKDFIQQRSGLE